MAKSKRKAKTSGGWSSIPGEKLSVDINPNARTENDTNDISKWTSPHYNIEDDDSAASRDLYDPDPRAQSNRFNVEEGAGDFGMFYSLELISGKLLLYIMVDVSYFLWCGLITKYAKSYNFVL